jgi:uncharacterized protein (TIGR03437 family)
MIDPSCSTGALNPYAAVSLTKGLSAGIDATPVAGTPVAGTPVLYAGSAPALACGIVQLNFQVPTGIPTGTYSFVPTSSITLPAGGISAVIGTIGASIYVK